MAMGISSNNFQSNFEFSPLSIIVCANFSIRDRILNSLFFIDFEDVVNLVMIVAIVEMMGQVGVTKVHQIVWNVIHIHIYKLPMRAIKLSH